EQAARGRVTRLSRRRAALARLVAHRVPAERAARARDAGPPREVQDGVARDDPAVLEDAAGQEHLAEARELRSRSEQGRVRGHAAQRERVLVVHFAAQDATAPRVVLGGRDAGQQLRAGPEARVLEPQRLEDPGTREDLERLARDALEDLAEEDDAEVAVERLRPGLVGDVHRLDTTQARLLPLLLLLHITPPP